MKLTITEQKRLCSATLVATTLLTLGCFSLLFLTVQAQPIWWVKQGAVLPPQTVTNNGVVTTNYVPAPNALVTQGQLKQFTVAAVKEFNAELTQGGTNVGAGAPLTSLTNSWYQDYQTNGYGPTNIKPADYTTMNMGQLKQIASLVYGQLSGAGQSGLNPSWIHTNSATDHVLANLGQLKEVFDFELLLTDDFNAEVDNRLTTAGTYTASKINIYSSVDDTNFVYTRNTGVWTGNLDLSGIAVWNTMDGAGNSSSAHGGTLITPTDIVLANHFELSYGDQIKFVDKNNVVYTATVNNGTSVNNTDINVTHLSWNGPTPTTLAIYPLLPANYQNYSPSHNLTNFPVVLSNQFRQVFVQDAGYYGNPPFYYGTFYHNTATEPLRSPYTLPVVLYDSGSPIFVVVNGKLIVVGTNYTSISAPILSDNIAGINAGLAAIGSSYQITTVDLSRDATY
jgi:hypothetical protein